MVTTRTLINRTVEQTGFNEKVVATITKTLIKNMLWALQEDSDHKVVLTNAVKIVLSPAFKKAGVVRFGRPISPKAMKVSASLTENLSKYTSQWGFEQALTDLWGTLKK
jgi:predicted thioredoxin/glutaredoxin